MKLIFMMILIAVIPTGALSHAATSDHVGIVKAMTGEVVITRSDGTIKATPNMKLFEGDTVQTGPNGKAGLILDDDTVISMGLNSRIVIRNFIFQPNEKRLSFIAKVLLGTVSFLSGQIAKLAPNQVHIETPYATVGIRGTHVLIRVE